MVSGDANAAQRQDGAQLQSLPRYAVIVTDPAGTVTEWDAGAEQLYGWTRAEAIGTQILGDVVVDDPELLRAAEIMEHLRAGKAWEGEFTAKTRDGRRFTVYVVDVPVRDDRRALAAIVGVSANASQTAPSDRARLADHLRETANAVRARLQPGQQLHLSIWEQRQHTTIIEATGEIDISSAGQLRDALDAIPLGQQVIVDLSAVTFVDSSGLNILFDRANRTSADRNGLAVVSPRGLAPRRVLDLLHAGQAFTVAETIDEILELQDTAEPPH